MGTGKKIDIWRDPSIPSSVTRKVITPCGVVMLSKVEDLIVPHIGQWDEILIRDNFSPVDVQRILQIPLHVQGMDDFVA